MLISYHLGATSIILRVKIRNSSLTTGAGLTGLTNASSGLVISTIADNEATATTYTAAGSTIESIATLGTFATPTATKCRFKEVDATHHPGVYELQIDNSRYAVSGAKSLLVSISGATNAAECDVVIPLLTVDPYDTKFGITGNVPADAKAINGNALAAQNAASLYGSAVATGSVAAVTDSGHFTLTSGSDTLSANDNTYNNLLLVFTSGANQFVPREITTYTGASKTVAFTGTGFKGAFPNTVSPGDTFLILSGGP